MTNDRPSSRGIAIVVPAVVLAVIYLWWSPHTADLAAQTARAELFRRSGFVPFWTGWYSGISTTSYSLTTPPLLGWLGPVRLGALSIVATALVAVPLLRDARRPRAGAALLVIAATLNVISGRTTFAVGVVVAAAALLTAERGSAVAGLVLAALATVTSPVAGFLLLVVAAALFLVDSGRRRAAFGLGAGAAAALGLLSWLARGDGGGYQPFTRASLVMAIGTSLVVVLAPVGRRVRATALVTILMLIIVYVVHSPIGANATRISVLAAAPAIVAAARSRVLMVGAVVIASLLPLAQLHNDLAASHAHDSARGFTAPVLHELNSLPVLRNHRVELLDTATHWPSTYLLPDRTLARGWERQIDESRNPMFYGRAPLTAETFRSYLDRNAVGAVAIPRNVPLDYGVTSEAKLIDTDLSYLHLTWTDPDWFVYVVDNPTPIVPAPLMLGATTDTGLHLTASAAGRYELRLRWSPYLTVDGGTVSRAVDGNAVLTLTRSGPHLVHAVWRFP